jgi:UDP:flavonoid glycosyltransferase YjiC (YdhE family)
VGALSAAVKEVIDNPEYKQRTLIQSARLWRKDGVSEALRVMEEFLDELICCSKFQRDKYIT